MSTKTKEKTQKPFLKRALRFYKNSKERVDYAEFLRAWIQKKVRSILQMASKEIALKLLDYLEIVLKEFLDDTQLQGLGADIGFHSQNGTFYKRGQTRQFFDSNPGEIDTTSTYEATNSITMENIGAISEFTQFYLFLHQNHVESIRGDHVHRCENCHRV